MNFKESLIHYSQISRLVGSCSVVVKDGKIIDEASYGYQSLETKELINKDTIFRIASISKIVVAMAVMTLVEEGKVSLDNDISDYLGYVIRNPYHQDAKITIRMLMTQTSSITDGYDDENTSYANETSGYNNVNGTNLDVSLKELLVPNDGKYYTPLTWDKEYPGTKFIYSNFGCGILACIVETITSELFTDYVERKILKPLNIDGSFRSTNINKKEKIASLYRPANDNFNYRLTRTKEDILTSYYKIFPLGNNYRGPAGGLLISMNDLSKIISIFLNQGKYNDIRILKQETIDSMLQLNWFGKGFDYNAKGLQLKFIDFNDKTFKGHTGSAYGVISYLFFNFEEKLGICFITNGGYYNQGIREGFYDIEENVFKSFLDNYWPKQTKETIFSFNTNNYYGYVNERRICFIQKPQIINNDIYLPLINILDGLNIVPNVQGNILELNIKGFKISLEYSNSKELISVNNLVNKLGLTLEIKNDQVIIKY